MNTDEYASLDDAALKADLAVVDKLTGATQPPPSTLEATQGQILCQSPTNAT